VQRWVDQIGSAYMFVLGSHRRTRCIRSRLSWDVCVVAGQLRAQRVGLMREHTQCKNSDEVYRVGPLHSTTLV
jgi:hypothetical protein